MSDKEIIGQLVAALEAARHGLVVSNNLRATDQAEEIIEVHLSNGMPRGALEWMTDNSKEIAIVDAALATAHAAQAAPARSIERIPNGNASAKWPDYSETYVWTPGSPCPKEVPAVEPLALPLMRGAFRTSLVFGVERKYQIIFAFPSINAMHKAEDEWHEFLRGVAVGETCDTRQGNGEIVTDWDRYENPLPPTDSDDLILVPRNLLGAASSAIDKKRDAPHLLMLLRSYTFAPSPAPAQNWAALAESLARKFEADAPPTSGPDYGTSNDAERAEMRMAERIAYANAARVRSHFASAYMANTAPLKNQLTPGLLADLAALESKWRCASKFEENSIITRLAVKVCADELSALIKKGGT